MTPVVQKSPTENCALNLLTHYSVTSHNLLKEHTTPIAHIAAHNYNYQSFKRATDGTIKKKTLQIIHLIQDIRRQFSILHDSGIMMDTTSKSFIIQRTLTDLTSKYHKQRVRQVHNQSMTPRCEINEYARARHGRENK